RVHVFAVDALDDLRLTRPQGHVLSLAGEEVRQGRSPRPAADDGHARHAGISLRVRKRLSVPASSRRMLARCENTMSAANARLAQNAGSAAGGVVVRRTQTGIVTAASIE